MIAQVVAHSLVTLAALLPISGVLGLAVVGTDFYLGDTGKGFFPELEFIALGPILVVLALACAGFLSRIWSAPGVTGDLDLSAVPAVTSGSSSAVFALGFTVLLWIVVRTQLHDPGSVLGVAAICAGPSALLALAAIAGVIRPTRQPKAAGTTRPLRGSAVLVALSCIGVSYLVVLSVLWSNVAKGPSTYGPVGNGYIALLAGLTALPAVVTVLANRGRAVNRAMLVLAATVATASVGWIGGVITSPPDLAALHGTVVLLCGPAIVALAGSGVWAAARAFRGKFRRAPGSLPVSAFPWTRVLALLAAMLFSALAGVAVAPLFASAAPVAVFSASAAGAVATSLAVSLTAKRDQVAQGTSIRASR